MSKTAVIIGATGLVGSNLVNQLLRDDAFDLVKVFVRNSTGIKASNFLEFIVDFEDFESFNSDVKGDVLFSCMGTTLKTAGSKSVQYKIDYTFQFEMAKTAKENGFDELVLVSSTGANSQSIFFYPKIKGQLEESVAKLGFNKLVIVRPSLLLGERKEPRFGEKIYAKILPILSVLPGMKKYKGITGLQVAKAMINLSKNSNLRSTVFELDELFKYV
ncbi:MAG: NAD(P)H-binding protein [Salibacteraceae bacterium]